MCACRCGIKVHLRDGTLRYIEGNRDHPVNRGVLCAKGSAGIMNVLSPARLRAPLKRIGPRGSGRAGIASRLPPGFQGGFLRGPLSEFRIARLLLCLQAGLTSGSLGKLRGHLSIQPAVTSLREP